MSNENIAGWERSKRSVFDGIVNTYDRIRWDYPDKLYEDIVSYMRPEMGKKALEIGAGTGKATIPFLKAGYDITAVELGEKMTEFLLDRFKEYRNFRVITASFEDALLEDNSYDLIYAASSFHWVNAEIGCPRQRPVMRTREDYLKPSELYRSFRFYGLEEYGFKDISMKLYDYTKTYTADDYISLLDTFSDHISLPDENRKGLYDGIKDIIQRHGGYHKVDYVFQLYMGRKLEN